MTKELQVQKVTGGGCRYGKSFKMIHEPILFWHSYNDKSYNFKILGKFFDSDKEAKEYLK